MRYFIIFQLGCMVISNQSWPDASISPVTNSEMVRILLKEGPLLSNFPRWYEIFESALPRIAAYPPAAEPVFVA